MNRLSCAFAFFAILALSALPASAQGKAGKVILVPQNYASIQQALDIAEPGDTVFVKEGVYKGAITLRDDVALIGASAERTVLRGDRKKPVVRGAQGAAIRHFTIEGGYSGILCANTFMVIEDCVIRGSRETGIHCVISLPVIRNNVVIRNGGSGIFCETTRSHRGLISNNVIAENTSSGVMLAGQSEVLLENNVFYFNRQYAVFTSEGARKSRIVNNLFYGNRQAGNGTSPIDRTNIHADPGYTFTSATGYTFLDASPEPLRGRGKDGVNIGPARRTLYRPSPAKPIAQAPVAIPAATVNTEQKPQPPAPVPTPAPAPVKADEKEAAVDTVKTEVESAVVDSAGAD